MEQSRKRRMDAIIQGFLRVWSNGGKISVAPCVQARTCAGARWAHIIPPLLHSLQQMGVGWLYSIDYSAFSCALGMEAKAPFGVHGLFYDRSVGANR